MKDLRAERSGNKAVILGKKVGWLLQGHFPLGDAKSLSGRLSTYSLSGNSSLTTSRFPFFKTMTSDFYPPEL